MALPYELIDEVLNRLPVKYILRCRCVSKEWCSLIDSAVFVEKHVKKATECKTNGGVIIRGGQYCFTDLESLYADEDIAFTEINDPLKTVLSDGYIVGTANCLACFFQNNSNFTLVNPSTRKYRKIPSIPLEFAGWFDRNEVAPYGFGYDHVNDDYKIVKIAQNCMVFLVYSMKSDCWKQLQNVPTNIRILTLTAMFTSGVLFWVAESKEYNHKLVVGFDLRLEQFKEVPFPIINGNPFVPHGGPLCVFDNYNSRMDVWMVNNYGAENPWYKAFSLEQPGAIGSFEFIILVAFSKNGKDVLLNVDNNKLVWYDPKRKVVKNVRIHGIPARFGAHLYRESLLQLTENEQLQKASEDKKEKKQKKRDNFLSKGFKLKL